MPTGAAVRDPDAPFFPGFRPLDVDAGGVRFAGAIGGDGPPLLLLHGWPETHIAWRKVAFALAHRHSLVIPDLPGYGASRPHAMSPRWTKRRVGAALLELMRTLNHECFALAGHDRGARAGYRLVLDHPGKVTRFASLAVVPTLDAMAAVDYRTATKGYHWFFLAQEADLPERLLSAAPDLILTARSPQWEPPRTRWSSRPRGPPIVTPSAIRRCGMRCAKTIAPPSTRISRSTRRIAHPGESWTARSW